jgi:hypothetical protein
VLACVSLVLFEGCTKKVITAQLDFEVLVSSEKKVRIKGKTNLPVGTKLMFAIRDLNGNFLGQDSSYVKNDNSFESAEFSNRYAGYQNGTYNAEVTMPVPMVQDEKVKKVIGNNGEYLAGDLIRKNEFGSIVVEKTVEFVVQ